MGSDLGVGNYTRVGWGDIGASRDDGVGSVVPALPSQVWAPVGQFRRAALLRLLTARLASLWGSSWRAPAQEVSGLLGPSAASREGLGPIGARLQARVWSLDQTPSPTLACQGHAQFLAIYTIRVMVLDRFSTAQMWSILLDTGCGTNSVCERLRKSQDCGGMSALQICRSGMYYALKIVRCYGG